jgi:two-component system response regulator TrcR
MKKGPGSRPARDNGSVTSAPVKGPRRPILGQLPRMYRADGSAIRVLLVDDERALTNLIRMALQYEGWDIDVAHDAAEAMEKYHANTPDVLVLDIMLPDTDGLGVLARIRDTGTYTPTLFLTARDSVSDRVTGLTAGGDDYMTKPFSLEELVARLRGLLRRTAYLTPSNEESLRVGDLELDVASHQVLRGGEPIALTSTEFDLLRRSCNGCGSTTSGAGRASSICTCPISARRSTPAGSR